MLLARAADAMFYFAAMPRRCFHVAADSYADIYC